MSVEVEALRSCEVSVEALEIKSTEITLNHFEFNCKIP